jgi:hypothetical protein
MPQVTAVDDQFGTHTITSGGNLKSAKLDLDGGT